MDYDEPDTESTVPGLAVSIRSTQETDPTGLG
jgi:hypothetical protein